MEFRLLGSLEVLSGGRTLALGGHKQRAVLALLLLHANEVVSIDRLIDGVWGPAAPRTAAASLQNAVSRLRRVLGPDSIETRAPGYLLHAADAAIDARWFESLVDEARNAPARERLALLTEALSLWRGPALADFVFDDFAQVAVQRLDELRLEAMERRVDVLLEVGRHAEVMGEIEALAAMHPSRERLRYLQMLALYRSGRQVDALEVFQETRLALAEELGLEPSEELKALERMILAHDPSLADTGGNQPASPAPTREARRVVTVLVADPVLPDGLDADAERAVAARCLAVAASVIERHGGRIEHLEGTELAGTFGLRAAHEDDTLRAARAASEIKSECASIDVPVRCGLETGAIDVVGDRLDGASLGVARSVKNAASAGEILLGAAAFRVLAGAVDAVPAAGSQYRLLGLIEGAPAVRRRFDAGLVGREVELEQLRAAIEASWAGGAARPLVVLGEPGIGKTRLAAAVVAHVGDGARCLTGRCVPYGEGTTYLPLANVVREAVGPGDLRRSIARTAAGMPDEDLVVDRLAGLVAGDGAAAPSAEASWAMRRFLEHLARERPLLVVLDDVHWAEPTLLDLVEYVTGWAEGPIAVLALGRQELIETRPGWANGAIALEPLSDGAARALLDALPERPLVGEDAVGTMLDSADGNPLFLEQIAAFAAERPLSPGEVPPTLETLLASRLDLLSDLERDVVERAAVAGREFSREAVDALSPPGEIAAVGPSLMALMRRRLVRPDRSAPPGEDGFRFEHVLIRDAAYASIPKSRRGGMHERLARWLGASSARKELVGFHLEQACFDGDRNIQFRREAATVLGEAAEEAITRLDTAAAVGLLRRAVSLVDVDDSLRRPLEIELGYALKNEGEVAESVVILTAVEEWARRTGDRHAGLRASIELAWPRLISGEISSADVCALADEAIPWFETAGDFRAAGRAARARANADDMLMRYGAAVDDGMRAAEFFERAGNPSFEVASQASALTLGPVPVDIVLDRVGSALADRTRSRAESGYLHTHVGHLEAMQGSFAAAREHIQQAERSHREFAQSFALVTVWPFGASAVELLAGDATSAEGILGLAIDSLDPVKNAAWFASLTAFRASALVQLGRFDEALLLAEAARATSPADDVLAQITWRQAISSAYARTGRWAEAEPFALESVGLARPTEASCCLAESLLALAEVREAGGERAAAATLVEEALVLLHAKGNLARIQQLAGRRDPL